MTNTDKSQASAVESAYSEGRQMGLAIGALAAGMVAFLSLLGLEKALLALALGYFVMREAKKDSPQHKRAKIAITAAVVYIVCFAVTLALFHSKIAELIRMFQQLA